jgi:transcription elongation factor Elf1
MKKYIPEHKVQRMRNLITKKFDDKTKIQIGYGKNDGEHKEGDVWVEGKTTWTIKDGITQNITKLDSARKSYLMPLICPNCRSKRMRGTLDKMFWKLYGECSRCRLSYETSLKLKMEKDENNTEWADYVSNIKESNYKTWIKNMYEVVEDFISNTNRQGYITETGKIEDWSKQDKTIVANTIRENAKNIEEDLSKKFETYKEKMKKE